jgi:hypothetical protein
MRQQVQERKRLDHRTQLTATVEAAKIIGAALTTRNRGIERDAP